jgi:hypothetical protein
MWHTLITVPWLGMEQGASENRIKARGDGQ